MATNGDSSVAANNQPVTAPSIALVHNGIIVNHDAIRPTQSYLSNYSDLDSLSLGLLISQTHLDGHTLKSSIAQSYAPLRGSASIACVSHRTSSLCLATNTGDVYWAYDPIHPTSFYFFASEDTFLSNALKEQNHHISHIPAFSGLEITPTSAERFCFDEPPQITNVTDDANNGYHDQISIALGSHKTVQVSSYPNGLLKYNSSKLSTLKRCKKCILPFTFPFIRFDSEGVCNYCKSYQKKYTNISLQTSLEDFEKVIRKYKRPTQEYDVIVPFSGGRDSCYALHLIVKELGLKPITFTYDWGMVTDLARRNISRVCSQLGVRNILISANIPEKRLNIKKNVSAWLNKPSLGMVPLFMAGDKHFFSLVNKIKKDTGIKLDLWAANPLENTDFKTGFCGVSPDFDKTRLDYLSNSRKLRMLSYYTRNFLTNPGYLNKSLLDTFSAFQSYYTAPRRDFYFMFHDVLWNEDTVNDVIIGQYDFETSPDSSSTWRIGDGSSPFYNYIYVTSRGFSEFDTFRSNQIREGHITREQALNFVLVENQPREESLRWYLNAINLDYSDTINTINELDKLNLHS